MRSGEYVKTGQGYELVTSSLSEVKHKKTCECEKCQRKRSKALAQDTQVRKEK